MWDEELNESLRDCDNEEEELIDDVLEVSTENCENTMDCTSEIEDDDANSSVLSCDSMEKFDEEEKEKYNPINFALTNARSLPPKIHSLISAFRELDLDFFMVTETWIRNTRATLENILDMESAENISLICKNRDSRGGGVCIAYDNTKVTLKRVALPKTKLEVVGAVGKISRMSKKVAVFAVYLPPRYKATDVDDFNNYLADAIENVKRIHGDIYVVVGGDINQKNISPAFQPFPEIQQLPGLVSRRGAALDLCYCNFHQDKYRISSHPPFYSENTASDHLVLQYRFKMPRQHVFVKIEKLTRPITDRGIFEFKGMLLQTNWHDLLTGTPTDMVRTLDHHIGKMYDCAFPTKKISYKSTDLPYITKRIKRLIRRKKRMHRRLGRCQEFKVFEKVVEGEIKANKERYFEKIKQRALDTKNNAGYHRAMQLLQLNKPESKWSPTALFPGETCFAVAEKCAEFFNRISVDYTQIPKPLPPLQKIGPPEKYQISARMKAMKKPRTTVKGDVDPKVVTECAESSGKFNKLFVANNT